VSALALEMLLNPLAVSVKVLERDVEDDKQLEPAKAYASRILTVVNGQRVLAPGRGSRRRGRGHARARSSSFWSTELILKVNSCVSAYKGNITPKANCAHASKGGDRAYDTDIKARTHHDTSVQWR
jgi:hypothetical protein